jgi:NADPH2 dehydrogenase
MFSRRSLSTELDMSISNRNKRRFFLPVNTGYVTDHLPDRRCVEFYARRSGNGLYCAIVGNVVIPGGVGTTTTSAEITAHPAWTRLASAIRSEGAIAGVQLATVWTGFKGMKRFVAKDGTREISGYARTAHSYAKSDVDSLFVRLDQGTSLAIQAGFGHVQIHAAHGYLFGLLIDSRLAPIAEYTLERLAEWSSKCKESNVETSLRFSLRSGCNQFDAQGTEDFWDTVARVPVTYVDASSGYYNVDKRLIYPSLRSIVTERLRDTVRLALCHSEVQFIYSGRAARTPDAELPQNVHIGICRDLIANPDFLKDGRHGCKNSMRCHYFSRERPHIWCGQWEGVEQ